MLLVRGCGCAWMRRTRRGTRNVDRCAALPGVAALALYSVARRCSSCCSLLFLFLLTASLALSVVVALLVLVIVTRSLSCTRTMSTANSGAWSSRIKAGMVKKVVVPNASSVTPLSSSVSASTGPSLVNHTRKRRFVYCMHLPPSLRGTHHYRVLVS
jgi:hypothetical protein